MSIRSSRIVWPVVFLGLGALVPPAHAGVDLDFVPSEVLVSDPDMGLRGIIDPEFDSLGNRFCWVDRRGRMFVSSIDPNTGDFVPPTGQETLVDTDVVTTGQIGNGPEWTFTDEGAEITYTKTVNGLRVLARAWQTPSGRWRKENLEIGIFRSAPIGSLDRDDPTPMIAYQGPKNGAAFSPIYVRQFRDAATEQMIPTTDEFRTPGARWVEGEDAVVFTRPMPEGESPPRQIFKYDHFLQELTQLTFDSGNKIAAFMWRAPEYDNEMVLLALVGEKQLALYRFVFDIGSGSFRWVRSQIIDPPSEGDFIWSPEPFVYNGKTYITMVTSTTDDQKTLTVPSEIWMSDLDPVDPLYRRLSNDDEVNRKDPEVYISPTLGPVVYSSVSDGSGPVIKRLASGIAVAP